MRQITIALIFIFMAVLVPADQKIAGLVIKNARIYTVDPRLPWAESLAIQDEKILHVGTNAEIEKYISENTRVIDAGSRFILPGFIDSHFHVIFGSNPDVLRISNANNLEEIRKQIKEFADSRPDLKWIEAEGWNYSAFPGGILPAAADLEGLTGGRPAFLVAYDYHTLWLNREALKEFGITRNTEKVSFVEEIEKDKKTGEPTGILIGFGSAGLSQEANQELRRHLPSHSLENTKNSIKENFAKAVRAGITTIVDPQSFLEDLEIYKELTKQGLMPARLQVALFHRKDASESDLSKFMDARKQFQDDRLRVAALKLYIDDVIEPHTAAMLEPYSDRPDTKGELLYAPQEFNQLIARLDKTPFQIFIHAIGDRGIRTALDALEYAQKKNGKRDSRHQLVHVECISPPDIPRFKKLGVVACMQPRHCAPDITGQWALAVGKERARYAWAFRSLRDAGAQLAFASDWNVAEMEPLIGIYSAMTRKGLDGKPDPGWIPEQTIDLETAIRAYTIQGAYANFVEGNRGSITPYKYADLIILSKNLFEIPPEQIKDVEVVWTLIGGREVHRSF